MPGKAPMPGAPLCQWKMNLTKTSLLLALLLPLWAAELLVIRRSELAGWQLSGPKWQTKSQWQE